MKRILTLIVLSVLFSTCTVSPPDEEAKRNIFSYTSEKGNSLKISLPFDALTSSDQMEIEIAIDYRENYLLELPDWSALKDSLNIVEIYEFPINKKKSGLLNRRLVLLLDNLLPGDYLINPLEFFLYRDNILSDMIVSDYIPFKIESRLLGDTEELIVDLEKEIYKPDYPGIIIPFLFFSLAAYFVISKIYYYFRHKNRESMNFQIPYELRIENCLVEVPRDFYSRLSEILKEYLDNTLFLSVQSQTTEEFADQCHRSPVLEDWLVKQLISFMQRADENSYGNRTDSEVQMNGDKQFCIDFVKHVDKLLKEEVTR